jgi:hypothetical protein
MERSDRIVNKSQQLSLAGQGATICAQQMCENTASCFDQNTVSANCAVPQGSDTYAPQVDDDVDDDAAHRSR